ncbi:SAM-dependent methyltransferase [Cytobacillus purgationiresistens]|uniref:SAM-dependent methyltransferase n=1 Tax=Cytobacillus purgationiresistens TaxID=863449 RepID=A0ABU0ARZ1_9BACI|nr:SAM-dependent methyltransferase [Cytobacillus purgationiresistens]
MIEQAELNLQAWKNSQIIHSALELYSFSVSNYHMIVSQLVLHYLEDFRQICENIYNSLHSGGKFVFSVQHPVITSSFKSSGAKRADWVVDDYFQKGKRIEPWIEEQVIKYHRTIEEYFMILKDTGFIINELSEATPDEKNFPSREEYERRKRMPLFLLFSCEKPVCEFDRS